MRLLFTVLSILLIVGFLWFLFSNLDSYAEVTLGKAVYPEVHLVVVVFASLLVGILFIGIIAMAQYTQLSMTNRRLGREVQKLETELNYLRTQPPGRPQPEPDTAMELEGSISTEHSALPGEEGLALPSAPVYRADDDDDDPDDDIYSGGRAV